ncbi:pseudouridine synthase [Corynebacterium glyciniphilum]|uniref:pseudouridine synthase n=1 Tax=Corynebacterium glyciniphilum TaxID=1404244 RepID=UPI0021B1F508|nr:pseudouridine synthase [Corynebacterium glyciniphilum]
MQHLIATQQHHDPTDDVTAVLRRFNAGAVRLDDGRALAPEDVVPAGVFIWFYRRPAPERPVPGTLREIYRDERLLVVDKPPFMSTLPRGQHITETAVVRARRQFGIDSLSPAHRLDRLTRGVLLFTVKQDVRGAYQRLFESRGVRKTYEAVTPVPAGWGELLAPDVDSREDTVLLPVPAGAFGSGTDAGMHPVPSPERPWVLRHHMVKLRGRMATYLTDDEPNAETRVTGIRLVGTDGGETVQGAVRSVPRIVWTLEPHSGRTHQLRVNMRLFGTPIVSDPLYGELSDTALWDVDGKMPFVPSVADEDFNHPMGLTAVALSFLDPFTGEHHTFHSTYTPHNL